MTTLSFTNSGLAFTPDEYAVLDVINMNVLEGAVNLAGAAPRLLHLRAFAHHFESKPTGLNPVTVIRSV
jgi:hypothetical protein